MAGPDLSHRLGDAVGGRVVTLEERRRIVDAASVADEWADLTEDVRALVEAIESRPGWVATVETAEKVCRPDLLKVGPKGYIHNWIYVGPHPQVGGVIRHPEFGEGTITRVGKATIAGRFGDGQVHAFDLKPETPDPEHFHQRGAKKAAAKKAVPAAKRPAAKVAPKKATPARKAIRPPAKPVPIRDLFAADDATVDATMRDVFEGRFGPYTTKVEVSTTRAGTRVDGRGRERKVEPQIYVGGKIYDDDGNEVGHFSHRIQPATLHYNDGTMRREMWAEIPIVELGEGDYDDQPTKHHGKGFGAALHQRAFDWYRASGVHGVSLSDHNGYFWASQGFNFPGGVMPDYKQDELRELIANLRAGKTKNKYGETIPKRLRDAPDLDQQIAAAEALLARLGSTKPGQPGYPTAREVSQLGRRPGQRGKTALWLGKHLGVSADELILNPDEGEVVT